VIARSITHDFSAEERERVHGWISGETRWATGIPREVFDRSLDRSPCFVLRNENDALCGSARAVTDRATFAYLCDVFVDSRVRGQGGKVSIEAVTAHPDLQGLRRRMLGARDAHGLYAQYGFTPIANPERLMQRYDPEIYTRLEAGA
jgi:hypothetical protein